MSEWIVLVVGSLFFVDGGGSLLKGWRAEQVAKPHLEHWGIVATGAGLIVLALPKIIGWPTNVGLWCDVAGISLTTTGAVITIRNSRQKRNHA